MGDILYIFSWVLCEVNATGCSLYQMLKQLYSCGAVKMSVLENGNGLLSYMQQCKNTFTEMFTDVFCPHLFLFCLFRKVFIKVISKFPN